MPHIILECSQNIAETELKAILLKIHQQLSTKLPADLASCKSRVQRYSEFAIADGKPEHAFVHLAVAVMKGRQKEVLDQVSKVLLEELADAFTVTAQQYQLHLSVEIRELSDVYHKK